MNLGAFIRKVLAKNDKFHLSLFVVLMLIAIGISTWQQHQFFISDSKKLEKQAIYLVQQNNLLTQKLQFLRENNTAPEAILSNAEIADKLDAWEAMSQAKILNLDFSQETYNKKLDLTRILAECITSVSGLYALLDEVIGKELFIHSLTLVNDTSETIKMRLQLVQPLREKQ